MRMHRSSGRRNNGKLAARPHKVKGPDNVLTQRHEGRAVKTEVEFSVGSLLELCYIIHRRSEPDANRAGQMAVYHGQSAKQKISGTTPLNTLRIARIYRTDSVTEIACRFAQWKHLFQARRQL